MVIRNTEALCLHFHLRSGYLGGAGGANAGVNTMTELLVDRETYETNAVHIGTQQKSADMAQFIKKFALTDYTLSMSKSPTIESVQFLNS